MKTLLVVDCQYDFIHGTLACQHAPQAIKTIIQFINRYQEPLQVFYSCDDHQPTNHSFAVNGGIWPIHCVSGELGSQLDPSFTTEIHNPTHQPNQTNVFYKGLDDLVEEYSAFLAKNKHAEILKDKLTQEVIVCGIASEYCVMESVKEILKAGKKVILLKNGLGYVTKETHQTALEQYAKMDLEWIEIANTSESDC